MRKFLALMTWKFYNQVVCASVHNNLFFLDEESDRNVIMDTHRDLLNTALFNHCNDMPILYLTDNQIIYLLYYTFCNFPYIEDD
jgi:hypothetical protein